MSMRRRAFTPNGLPAVRKCKSLGFTLIELLVVVGIIAMLVAILIPSIHNARLRAQEAVCASDTRSLTQACLAYAIDSQGLLPDLSLPQGVDIVNPTSIPDVADQVYYIFTYWRKILENSYGIHRDQWYSPTNATWNSSDEAGLYNWNAVRTVIGRFYLTSYKANGDWLFNGTTLVGEPIPASERPLFARRVNSRSHWSLMWTDLNREWHSYSPGVIDWTITGSDRIGSNHLYGGIHDIPTGSHESHIDGHVEWVTGDQFKVRSCPNNQCNLWW